VSLTLIDDGVAITIAPTPFKGVSERVSTAPMLFSNPGRPRRHGKRRLLEESLSAIPINIDPSDPNP
jgi:hypothetical protein